MLIRVMFDDGRFDMVKPPLLDNLLEEQKLTSFMRSCGWAIVGRDVLRNGNKLQRHQGVERRAC
jgi:hypothetical protein